MNITDRITKLVLARKPDVGPRGVKRAIANACGISYEAVRQWYAGDTGNIKNENLVSVAEKFDTTVDWLLSGDGEPPRRAATEPARQEPAPPTQTGAEPEGQLTVAGLLDQLRLSPDGIPDPRLKAALINLLTQYQEDPNRGAEIAAAILTLTKKD